MLLGTIFGVNIVVFSWLIYKTIINFHRNGRWMTIEEKIHNTFFLAWVMLNALFNMIFLVCLF